MVTSMVSWFAPTGSKQLGHMQSRAFDMPIMASPRTRTFKGRVVVLHDRSSGSSSEMFAAALRDLGGARLIGANTAGAVLPSAFDPLPNGDVLQYIIANYETVNGIELEGDGVAPDQSAPTGRTQDPLDDECILAALDWIYQGS